MSSSEQLRETLVSLRRDNERLRIEAAHAAQLFRALESLLRVETEDDPFAAVFAALRTVFDFGQALVLAESDDGKLDCIAAAPTGLMATAAPWQPGNLFRRVMAGRVAVTLANDQLEEWQAAPPGLPAGQPALYLPIQVRARRGILILLQTIGGQGFDRNHVALAKKFSLLASHALAARDASEAGAELRRKHEIELQNTRFDAALNNMTHGLIMFDAAQRLVVCNERYMQMYGLSAEMVAPGSPLVDILSQRRSRGNFPHDSHDYVADLAARIARGEVVEREIEAPDGRIFQVANRPMGSGGWVATHEDITERRRNERKIAFLALSDPLTGIANRAHFVDRIDRARERLEQTGEPFTILILDLDRFKDVNDTLGHAAGDQLLKEASSRLRSTLRADDILARLGGDEFAILQAGTRSAGEAIAPARMRRNATALAQRILGLISRPFEIDGHTVIVGTSIGIALAPDDSTDAGELMKKADLALYSVKSSGRDAYCFFDRKMTAEADERRQLESDLRRSLTRGELELHYQPIIDVATRRTVGAEALLRWHHPRHGLISPNRFISLAEDTGLIVPLGDWALKAACRQAAAWPRHVKVAVNISPVQFAKGGLLDSILGALTDSGLPPERLEVEITERLLLQNDAGSMFVLQRLKRHGVSIALDDFGTGYSSLVYLKMFAFDKIKIDRSFTSDLLERADCAAITSAVVNLGHTLGIDTLAEGIETADQLELLRTMGLSQAQGFLFGRPVPASQLALGEPAGAALPALGIGTEAA